MGRPGGYGGGQGGYEGKEGGRRQGGSRPRVRPTEMVGDKETFDYKDVATLQRLLTSQGKIVSRKRSGLTALGQRNARTAIKHARFIGLLPFVA